MDAIDDDDALELEKDQAWLSSSSSSSKVVAAAAAVPHSSVDAVGVRRPVRSYSHDLLFFFAAERLPQKWKRHTKKKDENPKHKHFRFSPVFPARLKPTPRDNFLLFYRRERERERDTRGTRARDREECWERPSRRAVALFRRRRRLRRRRAARIFLLLLVIVPEDVD